MMAPPTFYLSSDGIKNLFGFLRRSNADIRLQRRRILTDIGIVGKATDTALRDGLIDDRNYLVSWPILSRSLGAPQPHKVLIGGIVLTHVNGQLRQFEDMIRLAASLPNDSRLRNQLSAYLVGSLWDNLQHPPISYLGKQYRYRTADGSFNVRWSGRQVAKLIRTMPGPRTLLALAHPTRG